MSQYTSILDVGSSKVLCLICSPDGNSGIVVHGAGIREYSGYKNGALLDENEFGNAVVEAISMAEIEAKRHVRELCVAVPASFIKILLHDGSVEPKAKSKRISEQDVDAVITASLDFPQPTGYDLIHSTPAEFSINGNVCSQLPLSQQTERLSALVSHVYVETAFKLKVSETLDKIGLEPDVLIGTPLSESIFIIPAEERAKQAILIDVGGQTTDISIMHGSALMDVSCIPVGGNHFTNDLSYGLGINKQTAENIKRRYVYSLDYQDSIDTIRIHGGGAMRIDHSVIQYIIEERTSELADIIAKAIKGMGIDNLEGIPVYLTGGGVTLMRGGCEFMEQRLGTPVSVRMPWMPRLSSPNYASAYAAVDFVIHSGEEEKNGRLFASEGRRGLFEKIKDFFTK